MDESPQDEYHRATITTTDPLGSPPDGMMIRVSTLDVDPVNAEAFPLQVTNGDYFDGALLAVCIQYGDHYTIEGTAVMIGLGLAMSAKHVFDDHQAALNKGEAVRSASDRARTAYSKSGIAISTSTTKAISLCCLSSSHPTCPLALTSAYSR